MVRAFLLIAGGILALGSCTQRAICPAFQSAYIYDKDALRKKFSYFQEDSTPKILTASKNKYLIAEPTPYRKKVRSMQTVAMKPVPVQVPDSLTSKDSVSMEDLDRAARSVIDSTFIVDVPEQQAAPPQDSVYVISRDRELRLLKYNGADSLEYDPVSEKYVAQKPKYYVKDVGLNIEQDNYMWYLRDYLVLPDVRLARIQQGDKSANTRAAGKKERKGLKGFFKNLFKKKPKASDSTQIAPPPKEEFDFIDADTITQVAPPPPEKKGFFASRKKKSVAQDNVQPSVVPPANRNRRSANAEAVKENEPAPEDKPAPAEGF